MKRGQVRAKSFSRVGMMILCIILVTSQLCAGVAAAEGEETAATRIFYRDYEDYAPVTNSASGASVIANADNTYGILVGDDPSGWFDNSTVKIAGKNGYGVNFSQNNDSTRKSANWDNLDLGKAYTSGYLYIAFDIQLEDLSSDPDSTETVSIWLKDEEKTDHTVFVIHKPENGKCRISRAVDNNTWYGEYTDFYLDAEKTYKAEILCDIAEQTYKYYIDGVNISTKTTTRDSTAIRYMKLKLSNMINYFDNFTIMHYANSAAEDAAMSASASACAGNNTIQLRLTDSLYGAGLVLNDDNMSKLTLTKGGESVPVTVKKGESDGDYIITLTSGKLEDAEYTIGLNGAADTIGRMCASGELKVTPAVVQTKIFYRDYEDYTGGNGFLSTTSAAVPGEFGTASGYASGVGFAAKAESVSGKNGKGVDFNASAMTLATGNPALAFNKTLSSGELYVAFDVKLSGASESDQALAASYIKLTNSDDAKEYALVGIKTDGTLCKGQAGGTGWDANPTEYVFDTTAYHKVEVTYDLGTKLVTYYVDGVSCGTKTTTAGNTNITGMKIQFSNLIDYFDNFTVMHYADSAAENASMTADASAGADGSTINVTLKDTMLGSGLVVNSMLSGDITVSSAAGDTVAVTSVAAGSKTGEYVLSLENELPAGVYTLNLPANLTDTVGKKIYDNKVEFSFLPANSALLTESGNSASVTYNIGDA
ncbi:MAG: hypothetical protein Q4E94_06490, partial [Clostridia bacterium]|nr:hypothetical protein [Clostridia bacterium]